MSYHQDRRLPVSPGRGVRADHRARAAATLADGLGVRRPARRRRVPLDRHARATSPRERSARSSRGGGSCSAGAGTAATTSAGRRLDGHRHGGAGRGRLTGHPRPRGPQRGPQAAMHAEGWDHYFERLERLAATGDAGPDEWAWAPEELTPIVAAEAALAAIQPVLRGPHRRPTARSRRRARTSRCHELAEHLLASLARLGAMAGVTGVTEAGLAGGQGLGAWPDRHRRDGARSTSTARVPGPSGARCRPHSWRASCRWSWSCTAGTSPRPAARSCRVSDEVVAYIRDARRGRHHRRPRQHRSPTRSPTGADASAVDRLAAYAGRTPIAA